jgi:hypothetical protein
VVSRPRGTLMTRGCTVMTVINGQMWPVFARDRGITVDARRRGGRRTPAVPRPWPPHQFSGVRVTTPHIEGDSNVGHDRPERGADRSDEDGGLRHHRLG